MHTTPSRSKRPSLFSTIEHPDAILSILQQNLDNGTSIVFWRKPLRDFFSTKLQSIQPHGHSLLLKLQSIPSLFKEHSVTNSEVFHVKIDKFNEKFFFRARFISIQFKTLTIEVTTPRKLFRLQRRNFVRIGLQGEPGFDLHFKGPRTAQLETHAIRDLGVYGASFSVPLELVAKYPIGAEIFPVHMRLHHHHYTLKAWIRHHRRIPDSPLLCSVGLEFDPSDQDLFRLSAFVTARLERPI